MESEREGTVVSEVLDKRGVRKGMLKVVAVGLGLQRWTAEKRESLHTVGETVNWCSQYGDS